MATPGARMRLTVEVLPLTAENAHGPYQAAAIAAFKGRKFALPVQLEHTFEHVWSQIEQRYKRNYLSSMQAASFTIEKLQDAYDCDLDLSDTVGSIFEGENDAQMRMIKVVPSFINRDFSVPATSNLRPGNAQKRAREPTDEQMNKRRRLEEEQRDLMNMDPVRDQPVASTESDHSGAVDVGRVDPRIVRDRERTRRSNSGDSLVFVKDSQTGDQEFGTQLKEESPELGLPPVRAVPESPDQPFKRPLLPASRQPPAIRQPTRSPAIPSHQLPETAHTQQSADRDRSDRSSVEMVAMEGDHVQGGLGPTPSPQQDSDEADIQESPKSAPGQVETVASSQNASRGESISGTPSSPPPFMKTQPKPVSTYGRSPNHVQRDVSLLNKSRPRLTSGQEKRDGQASSQNTLSRKARSFQVSKPEDIESTPQENNIYTPQYDTHINDTEDVLEDVEDLTSNAHTSVRTTPPKVPRPGALKRPTHMAYKMVSTTKPADIQPSNKSFHTPRTFRGRASSDTKSGGTPLSASASSTRASRASPNTRVQTTNRRGEQVRHPSPKVIISVRSPSAQTPTASALHQATNGVSSKPNPTSPTGLPQTKKPLPKNAASVSVNDGATVRPSQPRKTPVPLPANIRFRQINGTPQSDEGTTSPAVCEVTHIASKPTQSATKGSRSKKKASDTTIEGTYVSKNTSMTNSVPPTTVDATDEDGAPSTKLEKRGRQAPKASGAKSEASTSLNGIVSPSRTFKAISNRNTGKVLISKEKRLAKTITFSSPSTSVHKENPDDPIILSSGGSSSDYSSSSEEDEDPVEKPSTVETKALVSAEISTSTRKITTDTKKRHAGIMSKMFPGGHAKARKKQDRAHQAFGPRPKDPITREAEAQPLITGDAELLPDVDGHAQATSEDLQPQHQDSISTNSAQTSNEDNEENRQGIAPKSSLWNAEPWNFGGVAPQNDTTEEADRRIASKSYSNSPSISESEDKPESEPESDNEAKSKSASAVNSARSSPSISRQPARYLSHSPTPERSSSDETSTSSRSPSPSQGVDSEAADRDTDSDRTSNKSSSSSEEPEDGDEDEDLETMDVSKTIVDYQPSSSLPQLPPQPTTLVPATQSFHLQASSQPLRHKTPVPLPSNTPLAPTTQPTPFSSSQSISQLAAARRATYSKFPSIRQQLTAVRASSRPVPQNKKVDLKTSNLGSLAKRVKGKSFNMSDSDSEDESSSDSSSDEESANIKGKGGASCSVA